MERIELQGKGQNRYTIQHIGRCLNKEADSLSKKCLHDRIYKWYLEITWEQNTFDTEDLSNMG